MKHLHFIFSALAALLLASCSSDSFKIEAKIEGVGTQNVKISYATTEGVVSDWVTVENDMLRYEGYAPEITVITITNQQNMPIIRFAAENGDNLKLKGIYGDTYSFNIEGSDVAEEWYAFLQKNKEDFLTHRTEMTDGAIAEYIGTHADNVVSTLLLIYNYSDISDLQKVDQLLAKINPEAKPAHLLSTYNAIHRSQDTDRKSKNFYTLDAINDSGEWDKIRSHGHSYTILWLWSIEDRDHRLTADSLRELSKEYSKRLSIADINTDADTTLWRTTFRSDSTKWTHYWVPGGPKCPALNSLNIFNTPALILVDSVSARKIATNNVAAITKALEKDINKSKSKANNKK